MKRTYYKVPIIGLQLLLFFSYIGFIFFYLYKLDKEVAFFDIPINTPNLQFQNKHMVLALQVVQVQLPYTLNQTAFPIKNLEHIIINLWFLQEDFFEQLRKKDCHPWGVI